MVNSILFCFGNVMATFLGTFNKVPTCVCMALKLVYWLKGALVWCGLGECIEDFNYCHMA